MPLRFDATIKDLAQDNTAAFVAAFDSVPHGPVTILNVDLSTVTASADLYSAWGGQRTKWFTSIANRVPRKTEAMVCSAIHAMLPNPCF
jgi:hypothetical protein